MSRRRGVFSHPLGQTPFYHRAAHLFDSPRPDPFGPSLTPPKNFKPTGNINSINSPMGAVQQSNSEALAWGGAAKVRKIVAKKR